MGVGRFLAYDEVRDVPHVLVFEELCDSFLVGAVESTVAAENLKILLFFEIVDDCHFDSAI